MIQFNFSFDFLFCCCLGNNLLSIQDSLYPLLWSCFQVLRIWWAVLICSWVTCAHRLLKRQFCYYWGPHSFPHWGKRLSCEIDCCIIIPYSHSWHNAGTPVCLWDLLWTKCCVASKFTCWNLFATVMVFGGQAFGRYFGGDVMNGISALLRGWRDSSIFFRHVRVQLEISSLQYGRPSLKHDPAGTLILDFQAAQLWEVHLCCLWITQVMVLWYISMSLDKTPNFSFLISPTHTPPCLQPQTVGCSMV